MILLVINWILFFLSQHQNFYGFTVFQNVFSWKFHTFLWGNGYSNFFSSTYTLKVIPAHPLYSTTWTIRSKASKRRDLRVLYPRFHDIYVSNYSIFIHIKLVSYSRMENWDLIIWFDVCSWTDLSQDVRLRYQICFVNEAIRCLLYS